MFFGWFWLLLDLNLRIIRIHSINWRDLPSLNLYLQIWYLLLQALYAVEKLINLLGLWVLHGRRLRQLLLNLLYFLYVFTPNGRLSNCCTVYCLTRWYAWIPGTYRWSRTVSKHILWFLHLAYLFLKITTAWHPMLFHIPQIPISSLRSWLLLLRDNLSHLVLLLLLDGIILLYIVIMILKPRIWRCRKALTCS